MSLRGARRRSKLNLPNRNRGRIFAQPGKGRGLVLPTWPPLLGLLWAYGRTTIRGSARVGGICLVVIAILITASILSRHHVSGMHGMLVPGLLYSISLVLLISRCRATDPNP